MSDAPVIRPSELARFWDLHPKTIVAWIKDGRLAAVRSPGNQYRLLPREVIAFCERRGLDVPPFVAAPARRLGIVGAAEPLRRAIKRALRGRDVVLDFVDDTYRGLFAAVIDPPAVVAIDATRLGADAERIVIALRATPSTRALPIAVFNASGAKSCEALVRAGASRAVARAKRETVGRELAAMLDVTTGVDARR